VEVFAFEPNPKNQDVLRNNIAANHFTNITAESLALSDSEGTAELFLHASDMSASLNPDFQHECSSARGIAHVRVTTLDLYFQSAPHLSPAVLKVDVEGHEASVLRGARCLLHKHSPDIIIEVLKPYSPDIIDLLCGLGYSFYQITDKGLTCVKEMQLVQRGDLTFLNYLVSKKSSETLAEISNLLVKYARSLDLRKTSKFFGPQ
jgi:FkbM family methyltransferase